MKDNRIILDTHKLLGFRLADTEQSLGVTSGAKVGSKPPPIISVKIGAKVGDKDFKVGQKPKV